MTTRAVLVITLGLSVAAGNAQTVKRVGPNQRDTSYQFHEGGTPPSWQRDSRAISSHFELTNSSPRKFGVAQWFLPDDSLADGVPVDSARLEYVLTYINNPDPNFITISNITTDVDTVPAAVFDEVFRCVRDNIRTITVQVGPRPDSVSLFFNAGSPFVQWLRASLPRNEFSLAFSNLHDGTTSQISISSIRLTVWYDTILVRVDQLTNGGNFLSDAFLEHMMNGYWTEWPNPALMPLYHGDPETLWADTRVFALPGVPPPKFKFQEWESNLDTLRTMRNSEIFTVRDGMHLTARFGQISSGTLDARLIDSGGRGDSICFKDPWFPVNWGENNDGPNGPYRAIPVVDSNLADQQGYGWRQGIFRNIAPGSPTGAHYSIKALSPREINGITYHFVEWISNEDSAVLRSPAKDTSAIVFKLPDARITAMYKSPLRSSLTSATGTSMQRKIATCGGYAHVVYESGGTIWYTNNTESGWLPEVRLSDIGVASKPSIAADQTTGYLYIAWQETNGSNWKVQFAYSTNTGGAWTTLELETSSQEPRPVATNFTQWSIVYWKGADRFRHKLIIPGFTTNADSVRGTVGSYTDITATDLGIVYYDGDYWEGQQIAFLQGPSNPDVITKRILYKVAEGPTITTAYFPNVNLTSYYDSWMSACTNPAIAAVDEEKVFVTWEANDNLSYHVIEPDVSIETDYVHAVFVKEFIGSRWRPVVEFSNQSNPQGNTTVAVDPRQGVGIASILWERNGHVWRTTRGLTEGNWSTPTDVGTGRNPTVPSYIGTYDDSWGWWTTGSSAPYSFYSTTFEEGMEFEELLVEEQGAFNLGLLERTESTNSALEGRLLVRNSRFELLSNGTRAPLSFSRDTSSWISTTVFTVPASADTLYGKIGVMISGFKVNDPEYPLSTPVAKARVKIDGVNQIVRTLTIGDLAELGVEDTILLIRLALPIENARERSMQVFVDLFNKGEGAILSEHIIGETDQSAKPDDGTVLLTERTGSGGPTTWTLYSCYPNPFNPSTEIRFDLPDPAAVSLAVYDLLGRKVADLASGHYEAGYHSAVWNATDMASGVYLARLEVVDQSGRLAYTKVNKLVLMK
jgi:hypothetical protein